MEPLTSDLIDPDLPEKFPEVYNNKNLSVSAKYLFTIIKTFVTETRNDIPRLIEKYFSGVQHLILPIGWESAAKELDDAGFFPNWLNTPEVRMKNQKKMLLEHLNKSHEMLAEKFTAKDFNEEDQFLLIALLRHRVYNLKEEQEKLEDAGRQDTDHLVKDWYHLESVLLGDLGCTIDMDMTAKHPKIHKLLKDTVNRR